MSGIGAGLAAVNFSSRWVKYGAIVLGVALVIGFLWWRIDAYGDRRFDAGVATERGKWEEAEKKLRTEAAKSATRADDRAADRLAEHKEQIDEDRKAVDQAVRDGTSPLDALFGG